jgi:hypothetical protein
MTDEENAEIVVAEVKGRFVTKKSRRQRRY